VVVGSVVEEAYQWSSRLGAELDLGTCEGMLLEISVPHRVGPTFLRSHYTRARRRLGGDSLKEGTGSRMGIHPH
jgi:hypothetical protein